MWFGNISTDDSNADNSEPDVTTSAAKTQQQTSHQIVDYSASEIHYNVTQIKILRILQKVVHTQN
jgi:hypothetical protein